MMKMTIKDIAALCKVGKSTVSRVLNNDPKVKAETRAKVQQVIDSLNFQPNRTARAMRGSGEPIVGIIISRLNSAAESQTLSTMLQALYRLHITPIIVESQFHPEQVEHHLKLFQQRRVDGVILFGFSGLTRSVLTQWKKALVIVARQYEGYSCVYYDDENAMRALLSKLYQNGHRDIAYLGVVDTDETTGHRRNLAYQRFCHEHRLTVNFVEAELNVESAYLHCRTLFERPVSALLCASNTLATGALKFLHETDRTLPLAYVGQNALLGYLAPQTVSLDFGYAQAGEWAVELLLKQLNGDNTIEQRQASFHLIE